MNLSRPIAAVFLLAGLPAFAEVPATSDTRIYQLDDRRVIIERLANITLPDPPPPASPAEPWSETATRLEELAAEWRERQLAHPAIHAAATVYHLPDGRTVTRVNQWRVNNGPLVSFWTSADFSLLAHPGSFSTGDQETHYRMMLFWTPYDVQRWADFRATRGLPHSVPSFPEFPHGPAVWKIDTVESLDPEPIDEQTHAAIRDIHEHYNRNLAALQAAYLALETERATRRAELKANPPQPRDISLRVSRLTPEQAAAWHRHAAETKGGSK